MLRDPATECKIENANPHANLPKQRRFFHKQIRAKLLKLSHWWPEGPEKAKKKQIQWPQARTRVLSCSCCFCPSICNPVRPWDFENQTNPLDPPYPFKKISEIATPQVLPGSSNPCSTKPMCAIPDQYKKMRFQHVFQIALVLLNHHSSRKCRILSRSSCNHKSTRITKQRQRTQKSWVQWGGTDCCHQLCFRLGLAIKWQNCFHLVNFAKKCLKALYRCRSFGLCAWTCFKNPIQMTRWEEAEMQTSYHKTEEVEKVEVLSA